MSLPAAPKPKPPIETIKDFITQPKYLDAIKRRAPKYLDPDRMAAIAISACQRNPDLMQCTPQSILLCLISAAELGLEVGGQTGLSYLVPFDNKHTKKKEAALIVGYKGYIHLALESGKVAKIEARPVREEDEFDIDLGAGPVSHKPKIKRIAREDENGNEIKDIPFPVDFIGCYAVATLADGKTFVTDWMDEADIDRIRRRAKSASGPWSTDPLEMARKTVVRRLAKYLPINPKLAKAAAIEDAAEDGRGAEGMRDITPDIGDILPEEPEQLPPAPADVAKAAALEPEKAKNK